MGDFTEHGLYVHAFSNDPTPMPKTRTSITYTYNSRCWLAIHGRWENGEMPSCNGELIKAHLIPQRVLLKELPAELSAGLIWDERVWVWACGGPTGLGGHHGAFDVSKRLRVPRSEIPPALEKLAKKLKLTWYLDQAYRRRAVPGAHKAPKMVIEQ
jgi:hypothetical protein